MVAWNHVLIAFLVGFLDFMLMHLLRPRLRSAFLSFLRMKVVFLGWAVFAGLFVATLVAGLEIATGRLLAGPAGLATALALPLLLHHLAIAWPWRNRFGAPDQRTRYYYFYNTVWDAAGRRIEGSYSRCLEHLAREYASVPWDDGALARIHARIVPHYREKPSPKRINPQLLTALKRFRTEGDAFAFFYSLLEEFGPRTLNGLLARL